MLTQIQSISLFFDNAAEPQKSTLEEAINTELLATVGDDKNSIISKWKNS